MLLLRCEYPGGGGNAPLRPRGGPGPNLPARDPRPVPRPAPTYSTRNRDRAARAGRTYVERNEPRQLRAQILTARVQKELAKARTNTKRALKAGDAARAGRHLARVEALTRRLEVSAKHMQPGRWLN